MYAWYQNEEPLTGFVGSANYTQNAFSSSMREVLTNENPEECFLYYQSLLSETVNCAERDVSDLIAIFERKIAKKETLEQINTEIAKTHQWNDLPKITLSLLDRSGEVPSKSGLNWGQREGREKNQAYINIPADIGRSGFFPERFETFTVVTDDGKQMVCVRAQDGGKGLHTTLDNSLLGKYFRDRLGLTSGEFVTKKHLLQYGRADVDFYKIDNENYYLDFSVL